MIDDAKLYLGGTNIVNTVPRQFYDYEINITVYTGRPTSWTGKVGLMYPSDYGYATAGGSTNNRDACFTIGMNKWNTTAAEECRYNDWLYDSSSAQWMLTPISSNASNAFLLNTSGYIGYSEVNTDTYAIFPTVYLKFGIQITGGSGEQATPYEVSL